MEIISSSTGRAILTSLGVAGVCVTTCIAYRFILKEPIDKRSPTQFTARKIKAISITGFLASGISVQLLAGVVASQLSLIALTMTSLVLLKRGVILHFLATPKKVDKVSRNIIKISRPQNSNSLKFKIQNNQSITLSDQAIAKLSSTTPSRTQSLQQKMFTFCTEENGNELLIACMASKFCKEGVDAIRHLIPTFKTQRMIAWKSLSNVIRILPIDKAEELRITLQKEDPSIFNLTDLAAELSAIYLTRKTEGSKLIAAILAALNIVQQEELFEKLILDPNLYEQRFQLLENIFKHIPSNIPEFFVPSHTTPKQLLPLLNNLREFQILSVPTKDVSTSINLISLESFRSFTIEGEIPKAIIGNLKGKLSVVSNANKTYNISKLSISQMFTKKRSDSFPKLLETKRKLYRT
jgi:hypothetical protein